MTRVDAGSPAAAAGLKVGDDDRGHQRQSIESLAEAKELHLVETSQLSGQLRLKLRSGSNDRHRRRRAAATQPAGASRRSSTARSTPACWRGCCGRTFRFAAATAKCVALMLTIHPITRFLLEVIRTDEPAVFGTGLSISQNISIVLLACAGLLVVVFVAPATRRGLAAGHVGPPSRGGPDQRSRHSISSPPPAPTTAAPAAHAAALTS